MSFTALLHDLIGLAGRRVSVTASAPDGHPVIACAGVLRGAVDVLGADAGEHEVLYFPVSPTADTGFMLTRSAFTGAEWCDHVLRITQGQLVIEVEPAPDESVGV